MSIFQHIYWYIIAMIEFRSMVTTSHPDEFMFTYDKGRDMAHKLTLRYFDNE